MGFFDDLTDDSEEEEVELRPNGETRDRLHREVAEKTGASEDSEEEEAVELGSGSFLPGMGGEGDEKEDTGREEKQAAGSSSMADRSSVGGSVEKKLDRLITQNKKIIRLLSDDESDTVW